MLVRAFVFLLCSMAAHAAAPDAEALYKQRCAPCHDGKPQPRMPSRQELASRTPESIYQAMFEGAMKPQSAGLSAEEERAIARFLAAREFGTVPAATGGKCLTAPGPLRLSDAGWNGWGFDVTNTRYQPNPGLTAADVPRLKLKWAFGRRRFGPLRPAGSGRRPPFHRQRERSRLRAGCRHRVHLLEV